MARESISAGSAVLAHRAANVAQMAQVQNQTNANIMQAFKNINDSLQDYHKSYKDDERFKAEQDYKNKAFEEQRRANLASEDMRQQAIDMENKLLPSRIKQANANAWQASESARAQSIENKLNQVVTNRVLKDDSLLSAAAKSKVSKTPTPTQDETQNTDTNNPAITTATPYNPRTNWFLDGTRGLTQQKLNTQKGTL